MYECKTKTMQRLLLYLDGATLAKSICSFQPAASSHESKLPSVALIYDNNTITLNVIATIEEHLSWAIAPAGLLMCGTKTRHSSRPQQACSCWQSWQQKNYLLLAPKHGTRPFPNSCKPDDRLRCKSYQHIVACKHRHTCKHYLFCCVANMTLSRLTHSVNWIDRIEQSVKCQTT